MNLTNNLQQTVRSVAVMVLQCRLVFVLLSLFLFSAFTAYATLTIFSEILEKRIAIAFSAGIFLKPGTHPEKVAIEKARAIQGVRQIVILEPAAAPGVITTHLGRSAIAITQGVPVDRFPFTIVLHLEREYFLRADEVIRRVAGEISGVQEIRWPIEGHKNAINILERLTSTQTQLGIVMLFVLIAGCLSIVRLVGRPRPAFRWQYSLTGVLSGASAALLMLLSVNMAASITGWELALNYQLYLWMLTTGLTTGVICDISSLFRRKHRTSTKKSKFETNQAQEVLP